MPEKTKSIKSVSMFPCYCCFLLLILCFLFQAMPCHAWTNYYASAPEIAPESTSDPESIPVYHAPEINVRDRIVRAGLLYDVAADAIVWEKNKDESCPIASLTKMMVALLAMEDIYAGKADLDSTVRVTSQASKITGSKVYLKTGCCVSVEELLKAALISSGNDAAYLLGQYLGGGSIRNFVQRMNQRAVQLGMKNTYYSNPTGLPAYQSCYDNRSSPADLLILAKEMLKYEQLTEIAGTSDTVITQDKRPIKLRNHNRLVALYSDVDGFKTGFTQNAKFCLVATANKNDRRLISIVLGIDDRNRRNLLVANMISHYYEALGMGGLERKADYAKNQHGVQKSIASALSTKNAYADGFNGEAGVYHQVKKGETLYRISKTYGCTVAQLKAWNRLRGNRLHPGQQLAIHRNLPADNKVDTESVTLQASAYDPAKSKQHLSDNNQQNHTSASSQKSSSHIIHFYTVRPGDTLWTISQKYEGVSVHDIMKTNRIRKARNLKPGITLKIVLDV